MLPPTHRVPLFLVLVAGVFTAPAAVAQERGGILVVGWVTDAVSSLPMPSIPVRLVPVQVEAEEGGPTRETVTDTEGRFRIADLRPGRYRLEVGAFGYSTIVQEMTIRGASPFEIRAGLVPQAVELAPVVVTSMRSPRLAASGFYDRRTRGMGDFLDRDQIEDRFASRTSDLFNLLAGVQVRPTQAGTQGLVTLRGGCRPDIIIDGINLGPNVGVDDVLTPTDLEGVEVYRGAATPIQYSRSTCGAIVFWTADPSTREGVAPFSVRRVLVAAGFIVLALVLTR
jgi:hypothetical protein